MALLSLKILLALYIAYALLKFFDFFYQSYDRRIDAIRSAYANDARAIKAFDSVVLILMVVLVVLLFWSGVEYLSFTTGLLVGSTLIQVYFHRFCEPLPPDKAPEPPVSAIKLMSYAIQANPEKPWRELAFLTVLFVWALYRIFTQGFGLLS
jgi:hypothetical protein